MVLGPGDRHEHRQVNRADSRLADNNALAPRIQRRMDRLHHLRPPATLGKPCSLGRGIAALRDKLLDIRAQKAHRCRHRWANNGKRTRN